LWPDAKVHRGDMVEEGVAALHVLFSGTEKSFEGKYYKFRNVQFSPRPLQSRLPIYFGGNSPMHIRRIAKAADGWIPAGMPAEQLRVLVDRLHEAVIANGRDPAEIHVAPQFVVHLGKSKEAAVARYKQSQMHKHLQSLAKSTLKDQALIPMEEINLIGDVETVIARAEVLKKAGVTHFLGLYFAANDVQELLDQMQLFSEEVMPRIQ
jgi:alkanesulfonate monooxygenase SsuD/methylene tetrahydromethanopterin reductase-like flavin-dependent oxidoreductase (luciferase family)